MTWAGGPGCVVLFEVKGANREDSLKEKKADESEIKLF